MPLPSFFILAYTAGQQEMVLDEDNSRHVIQVLRMRPGEQLQLTDGQGHLLEGEILDDHKKRCRIAIRHTITSPPRSSNVTIAISPLKNNSRFEWFLEKATEIGVSRIIPLLCERTERPSTRHDRLRNILVSAMLQSQQTWLPELPEPQQFAALMAGLEALPSKRLIAHCLEAPRPTNSLATWVYEQQIATMNPASPDAADARPQTADAAPNPAAAPPAATSPGPTPETFILIGPEGDFTPKEVDMALAANFLPVSLGVNRLRTETAGVVAATLLCIK